MTRRRTGALATMLATLVAVAAVAASAPAATSDPIVIGWAYDSKGAMSPFDTSAVASAQLHLKTVNRRGGALGRKIVLRTCDTQGNKPTTAKACAARLLGGGAVREQARTQSRRNSDASTRQLFVS